MNNVLIFLTNGIINYLFVASLIATVITALAWVIIKLVKVKAAVYRHLVWLYTLIAIIALPFIWLYGPKLALEILPVQTRSAETSALPRAYVKPVTRIARNQPAENNLPTPKTGPQPILVVTNQNHSIPFKAVLALVWLLGVVFMATRLFVGWFRLRRIYMSAEPVSESEYFEDIFDQKVKVLLNYHVDSPVCFGIFRPVIMLPQEMYNNSSSEDLKMVLRHEFAHIKRGDCWINLVQRIIEAVFFFHPFIWYASFQLTRLREQICDNHVLARGASAAGYVELLSRIGQQGFEKNRLHAVALFEGRLLYRVRSLLDPKHDNQIRVSRWALIISGVVAVTCLIICTLRLEAKSEIAKVYKDVFVYVTDNQGTAVADASIEALADYKPVGHARTDTSGTAVLNVPQGAAISWIIALKSGKGFDYYENYKQRYTRLEEIPEQIALVLDGSRDIVTRGVDSEDNPVPGVPFVPWTIIKQGKNSHVNLSGSVIARVLTNEQGLARFDWFPSHTTEEMEKSVRTASTFMVQGGDYYWPDYQTSPYSEYSTETVARLLHRTPISGKVILPDGSNGAGILVMAEGRGNTPFFYRGQTRTGPDGSYLLNVYPDQVYMVTVIDDFWASDTQSGIVVRENESVQDIDLHLFEGTLIGGRVTTDPNDKPVVGELLFLQHNGPELAEEFRIKGGFSSSYNKEALVRTVRTDDDGRYSLRVGPGKYTFGSRTRIVHPEGENLQVGSEKEILRDFRIKETHLIGLTAAIPFANQEKVYDGTMVFNNCGYCHHPSNKSPGPRPLAADSR